MKGFLITVFFILIARCLFSQLIIESPRIIRFETDEYKLTQRQKHLIDSIGQKLARDFKDFGYRVRIKKFYLVSVLCVLEEGDNRLAMRRIRSVRRYIRKTYPIKIYRFKGVVVKDRYTTCDAFDHGVEMSFTFGNK